MVSAEAVVILVVHFLVPECMKFYTVAVGGGLNIACCIVERLKLGFQANTSAVGDKRVQAFLLTLHGQTRPKIKGLAYCLTC